VHNNIFFSFAVDGDFSLMQQMREQNSQTDETATDKPVTSNGDVSQIMLKQIQIQIQMMQIQMLLLRSSKASKPHMHLQIMI
jgi:hypothetical protein